MADISNVVWLPLLLVAAYLIGAIPSAQLLARLHGVDLRTTGSGNIGAGNLTQSVGLGWGVAAAIFDGLKGLWPVLVAKDLMGLGLGASGVAGLAAVVGQCWSIFMKGRSGRGLATSAGLVIGLDPVLMVWVGGWALAGWKIGGGVAGFLGWGMLPLVAFALGRPGPEIVFLLLLTGVLIGRRMQGNRGSPEGFQSSLRRAIFDVDDGGVVEGYGHTSEETWPT